MTAMPDVALMLGPVEFYDFEIPSGINFGGRQLLATHQLIGGQRVLDKLGPSETEVSFSGTFSGPAATMRARLLNLLRREGNQLGLSWDVFFYTVVLSRFDADYKGPSWIPYRIVCTVLRDEATGPVSVSGGLSGIALSDIQSAAAVYSGTSLDVALIQNLLAVPEATSAGTSANQALLAAIAATQSGIQAQTEAAQVLIGSIASASEASPLDLAGDMQAAAGAAGQLATALSAMAFVDRASRNLSSASS